MAEVQRLVGVGAGIFHHHQRAVGAGFGDTEIIVGHNGGQYAVPHLGVDLDVEEAFHHVVVGHCRLVFLEPFADFFGYGLGAFACGFHPGENNKCVAAAEFAAGGLQAYAAGFGFQAVECAKGFGDCLAEYVVDGHCVIRICRRI